MLDYGPRLSAAPPRILDTVLAELALRGTRAVRAPRTRARDRAAILRPVACREPHGSQPRSEASSMPRRSPARCRSRARRRTATRPSLLLARRDPPLHRRQPSGGPRRARPRVARLARAPGPRGEDRRIAAADDIAKRSPTLWTPGPHRFASTFRGRASRARGQPGRTPDAHAIRRRLREPDA